MPQAPTHKPQLTRSKSQAPNYKRHVCVCVYMDGHLVATDASTSANAVPVDKAVCHDDGPCVNADRGAGGASSFRTVAAAVAASQSEDGARMHACVPTARQHTSMHAHSSPRCAATPVPRHLRRSPTVGTPDGDAALAASSRACALSRTPALCSASLWQSHRRQDARRARMLSMALGRMPAQGGGSACSAYRQPTGASRR